eukprot:COSAG06_NODE_4151_length_4523_cov_5.299729_2_plen_63_part_00
MSAAPVCSLAAVAGVGEGVMLMICASIVCLFMRLYPLLIPNPRQVQNHPFSHPAAASTSERH